MAARATASLWNRFAAVDPGLIRLTSAMRAVLGSAAALAVLTALGAPETALVVGGFTAMTTSLAISDLHPRNQLITLGLAGTVLGVVFGYGLAALVGGDGPVLLILLLLCMFGMFYTPSQAYWAVTIFITGTLSMLLALMDTLSTQVLLLRVQETALGVSCGILAAVLVLPTTVRRASDEELVGFLRVLDRLLRGIASSSTDAETPTSLDRAARDLDHALESFRKACLSLTHPLNPQRGRRHHARHLLELLEADAYHARSPAATAERLPAGHAPDCAPAATPRPTVRTRPWLT